MVHTYLGGRAMRNMTKKQMSNRAIMRTLVTAIVMTGWIVFTGCSYLQHPNPPIKQVCACIDQGRSGYWCPEASSKISDHCATPQVKWPPPVTWGGRSELRLNWQLPINSFKRDRLSEEFSVVKHRRVARSTSWIRRDRATTPYQEPASAWIQQWPVPTQTTWLTLPPRPSRAPLRPIAPPSISPILSSCTSMIVTFIIYFTNLWFMKKSSSFPNGLFIFRSYDPVVGARCNT